MALFKRKKVPPYESEQAHDMRVEVVVAQEANKEIVEKAKEASQHLTDLLEANHFHIKIYKATGGKTRVKTKDIAL